MGLKIPPPPTSEKDITSPIWGHWFEIVKNNITTQGLFSNLDFTGSNITSILTRNHNDLQSIQGGSSTERYHLSLADYTTVVNIPIEKSLFYSDTSQTLTANSTPSVITFNQQPITDGITIASSTQITVPTTGLYVISFSAQLTSTSSSTKNIYFWPRINGSDVGGSTMKISLSSATDTRVVSRSGIFSLTANDYVEACWATDSDYTKVELTANSATAFCPATPSVTLSIYRIQS